MATNSIFDLPEFKPLELRWNTRLRELTRRQKYYDGTIYKNLWGQLGWLGPRLYKGIKPLYLPLARAVDVDAGIVPGGWAMDEDAPAAWSAARDVLFDWSNWSTEGVLFVHYGATYGQSGLKIADLREQQRVIIAPVKPTCFMLVPGGEYDSTPRLALWIETRTDASGGYEYAEVITAEEIKTYKNGALTGFDEREPAYPNELGFVPFVEVEHIKTGEALGEATFQKAIPMLDEVNEIASYLADVIKKHAEPQWAVFGAGASDLNKSGENVWFFDSAESRVEPVLATVDIPGVLEFVREIRDQVFGSLPELAFDELKTKTQIATATLELQLMELVLKIKRVRPNYDHGLADALRLAGRAAGTMGAREITALDDEALEFDPDRPVLPLDPLTEIQLELQQIALERERMLLDAREEGVSLIPPQLREKTEPDEDEPDEDEPDEAEDDNA
jgi:hypothetical protein